MKDNSLKKVERILFTVFVALGIVVVIGIVVLIKFGDKEAPELEQEELAGEEQTEDGYDWEAGLSDSTLWLPENGWIYSKVPDFTFYDEKGELHNITEFEGKPTVVVFWASWCGDCEEQMPLMAQYMELSKQYGDINFVFINKTDGDKETKESALAYFDSLNIGEGLYFDEELSGYDRLGIHNIPTTLFLDENGIITAWSPKQITQESKFEAILNKALNGGSDALASFITNQMMDENGGIHSAYSSDSGVTYASDILSESEGAMLEYAANIQDKELFDEVFWFVQTYMWKDGLTAWTVKDGEASQVNALIDDLRIYDALTTAQDLWGGYEEIIETYQSQILKFGQKNGKFVDFYDADDKEYAKRFTLCYGDLVAMQKLSEADDSFAGAYENCKELLIEGQISDDFPLYYSWYNYKTKKYEKDDLNMAEAMVTLLHLSEADLLPQSTLNWLKTQMNGAGVKARYTVKGTVAEGYNYDSTAVYALIAMIGANEEDASLVNQAVRKMEKMRIDDTGLAYNGAFGMEDGTQITSFDQIMPLLAYVKIYGR
ncbi:TlpA family protein disulfide reductase [Konateibacter massiliensis]|uniref:TlpA family protein disulfide reductase n=1 Tax=Konateibacter massiliensis TaxID=2002841 RepID=UPI000C15944A|nr:TlpA disulfide reductase family protein [Konateibacter massiliensis]